jgi:hypothetical protein
VFPVLKKGDLKISLPYENGSVKISGPRAVAKAYDA